MGNLQALSAILCLTTPVPVSSTYTPYHYAHLLCLCVYVQEATVLAELLAASAGASSGEGEGPAPSLMRGLSGFDPPIASRLISISTAEWQQLLADLPQSAGPASASLAQHMTQVQQQEEQAAQQPQQLGGGPWPQQEQQQGDQQGGKRDAHHAGFDGSPSVADEQGPALDGKRQRQ